MTAVCDQVCKEMKDDRMQDFCQCQICETTGYALLDELAEITVFL